MASTSSKTLPEGPRKMLSAKLPEGERPGKKFSDQDAAQAARRILRAGFDHSDLSDQEAAYEMGYANQAEIAKFLAQLPAFIVRMLYVRQLRKGLLLALADDSREDIDVETVIKIRRRA